MVYPSNKTNHYFYRMFDKILKVFRNDSNNTKDYYVFDKFQTVLPDILFELDINYRFTYINPKGLSIMGFTTADLERGLTITSVFPTLYEKMEKQLQTIHRAEDIAISEYVVDTFITKAVPFYTRTVGIFSGTKLTGYRGTIRDNSEHKNIEKQLIKEKAFLKGYFDYSPEPTVTIKADKTILSVNHEFVKLFGYNEEEIVGKNLTEFIVPPEMKADAMNPSMFSKENPRIEKQTIRQAKNGKRVYVSVSAASIILDNKAFAFIVTYRDTSRYRRHHILQEVLYNISSSALILPSIKKLYPLICKELNNLWQTNNFFIALYDDVSKTLSLPYFIDEKDKFEKIPIAKTLTGWVVVNKKPVLLKHQDICDLEKYNQVELVGSPCAVWMGAPLEIDNRVIGVICIQDYNDEDKYNSEDLNLLVYIAKHLAIAIDKRMILDSLLEAKQAAEDATNVKQAFLSTMSHEIRTPLNEVIGIANILLQENTNPEFNGFLKSLLFSSNHLLALVNDVLDFSKIEAGKIEFEKTKFSLANYLNDLKRAYSIRASNKQLTFELIKSPTVPEFVIGDQLRLNQILGNLFSNALKFTSSGTVKLMVTELHRENNKSTIEFKVQDSGIGISAENIDNIFDNYVQASSSTSRKYGGTGLGLPICKRLVELQGGKITVNSVEGKGSSFSFAFKYDLPDDTNSVKETKIEINENALVGKRILIAEDNRINFMVVSRILKKWGVEVLQAENGQEALNKIYTEVIDLVLMDLHMPVMDGIEATIKIRESSEERIKKLPVVALTAVAVSECEDKLTNVKFDDYILKPFKPENLYNTITKLLLK